jgi:hypothetical protein
MYSISRAEFSPRVAGEEEVEEEEEEELFPEARKRMTLL